MHTEAWLAYGGYLIWLSAGLGDFICHRRADLPHTSGVEESFTHLLQLATLGVAIMIGLAFEMSPTIAALMCVLVVTHAGIGYWDTRIAFRRRRVLLPIEQHFHSVLDMAPIVALGWLLAKSWPKVISEWQVALRLPALPIQIWVAVLTPAVILCVVPALLEFRAARAESRVRRP
jgi:hypothetical protein